VALSEEELDTFRRLETRLGQARRDHVDSRGRRQFGLETLDDYYELQQRIRQLGLAVPPELEDFLVVANWCRTAADAIEERVDLEGFRLPGEDTADDELWDIWQANDMDEESQLAHLDALVLGRSYVCVGAGDKGPAADEVDHDSGVPLITVESPFEMIHENDPRTRQPSALVKVYRDGPDRLGTLYLPNSTSWLRWSAGAGGRRGWVEDDRDDHMLGTPPGSVLLNRTRVANRYGVSELVDVIPLVDAASRALTNAQVATETLAVPARYVFGATQDDFVDSKTGEQIPAWESYFGRYLAMANEKASAGQFSAADLANFKTIVDHYGQIVSGLKGLPTRYLGLTTANPPSADGIRADEARLVKTAERRHRSWGGGHERTMRISRRFIDGAWDPRLKNMETLWRDPATPTRAQAADAAVKLHQAGILPLEATWEELGYSATRRKKLREQFAAQAQDPVLERVARELAGNPQPAPPAGPVLNGAAGVA
jgi:hypothetical protein